jgi:alpha-tubulin suppressor-like RCC1 family protein
LTIKQISAGNATTCVIASDNNAYCWGLNDQGQLGDGTIVNKSYPVAVTRTGVLNGLTIKQISVAGANVCVIASDNYPYCWGQNDYALGVGSTPSYSSVPMAVTRTGVLAGLTVKKISTGGRNTCVIASDNNGYCWGQNMYGENGNGTSTVNTAPVAVTRTGVLNGLTLKDISTGTTTCAIASDNNAYCWGQNATNSNLGNNSTVNSNVPVTVYRTGALNGLTSVSLGRGMAMCMVASNAKIYCWGISDYSMVPGALAGMTSLTVRTE